MALTEAQHPKKEPGPSASITEYSTLRQEETGKNTALHTLPDVIGIKRCATR
jgi:hypothetical protein